MMIFTIQLQINQLVKAKQSVNEQIVGRNFKGLRTIMITFMLTDTLVSDQYSDAVDYNDQLLRKQ